MKRAIFLGISAVLTVLLAVFGSDLLDMYRLQTYLDDASTAYVADAGAWPQLKDTCSTCHGGNGNSLHQGYPSLSGQPEAYLVAQLKNFASGQRHNPTMGPLSISLSDKEIGELASYYAKKTPIANDSYVPDAALRQRGEALVKAGNCTACHGAQLQGQGNFPRLAGQGDLYLVDQFIAFKDGTRSEPSGMMKNIAVQHTSDELKAMATYIAGLSPTTAPSTHTAEK